MLWLAIVAYPLWSNGTLAGSVAEGTISAFLWVLLPIAAMPWGHVLTKYLLPPKAWNPFSGRGGKAPALRVL